MVKQELSLETFVPSSCTEQVCQVVDMYYNVTVLAKQTGNNESRSMLTSTPIQPCHSHVQLHDNKYTLYKIICKA